MYRHIDIYSFVLYAKKRGNWKQWKREPEMENGNGKRKQSTLDANECVSKTFE